jgi:hypothetical protein
VKQGNSLSHRRRRMAWRSKCRRWNKSGNYGKWPCLKMAAIMAFSNKGRYVKSGTHVTVVIGRFRAEGLLVEGIPSAQAR